MPITLKQPRGLTASYNTGGLAIVGANTTYNIATALTYSIDGKVYGKATGSTSAPTTDANTGAAFTALAADEGCVFVWLINAAGTVTVAQGPVAKIDGVTDGFVATPAGPEAAPQFPYIADSVCPFAYSIHQTAGTSSAWTFGTSNWNATGLTDIAVNVSTLPVRPPTDATA